MANHLSFDTLSQLVERRASTAEEPRARRHLATCARCRSEFEWLQRVHGGTSAYSGEFDVDTSEGNRATARLRF